ncbi:hypothetical protein LVY72_21060 [Arthrobacter sp. I2-34]|uniref:Uncharacterized protein n=1 Tax=Arthrobacter hankyongi TaxID=2904801 RepID=A0ABS9LCJ7_9MICC|nr:hypothetical protein [Arthrobacter hankyongi]MCG2624386.1 hypothetical protein [Arthrobacter hankyongi]
MMAYPYEAALARAVLGGVAGARCRGTGGEWIQQTVTRLLCHHGSYAVPFDVLCAALEQPWDASPVMNPETRPAGQ